MSKTAILAGSTSVTRNVYIRSSATGGGLTGLVYNTSNLTAYYGLQRAASAVISLVTQTVTGAYSSGGFVEIDATNMPGWYRLDIPNAALASGQFVDIHLRGAANMVDCVLEIELTAINNQDAVRGGMTALPNGTTLATSAGTMVTGTAVTGTLSSTVFTTNLGSTVTNAYVGRTVLFTSGTLINQAQTISAYSNTGQITVASAFTTSPSNADTFIIV